MKPRHYAFAIVVLGTGMPMAIAAATKGASDIIPPVKRQASVEAATNLAKPPVPAPLPENVRHLFNPPEFSPAPPKKQADGKVNPAAVVPEGPTDRQLLETLAGRIPNASTIIRGGKAMLLVGGKMLEIGSEFVVGYNGQDYELKLTAIDRTTFTLRYRGEETTRPLRIVK